MSSQLTQVDLDELLARQFSESSDDFEFDEEEEEEEEEIDLELEQAKLLSQQLNQKEDKPATIRKRKKNNKNYQLQKRLNARNPKKYTPKTKLKNKIAKKNNNNNNNDNNNVNNEEFPTFDERLIDNYSSIPFYREPPRVISEEELQRIKAQSIIDEENRIEREIQEVEYIEAQLIDQSREEYEKELSKQLNNLILEEQKQENEKQEIFNELEEFSTQYYQNSISDVNIKFRIQFSSGMKEFKMRSSDDSLCLFLFIFIFIYFKLTKIE